MRTGPTNVLPHFKKSEDYMGLRSEYRTAAMDLPKDRRSVTSEAFVAQR